jgi:hypothetical protein
MASQTSIPAQQQLETAIEEWRFLRSPYQDIISRTVSRDKLAAEAGDNPEEGEHLPLEAVTRRVVKTQQTEKTKVCALVSCKVCELVKQL